MTDGVEEGLADPLTDAKLDADAGTVEGDMLIEDITKAEGEIVEALETDKLADAVKTAADGRLVSDKVTVVLREVDAVAELDGTTETVGC